MSEFKKKAIEITGDCICDVAYTSRNRTDPQCSYCRFNEEIEQALRETHESGYVAGAIGLRDAALNVSKLLKGEKS